MLPSIGGDLHWEMFWSGELQGLDQKAFSEKFASGKLITFILFFLFYFFSIFFLIFIFLIFILFYFIFYFLILFIF